MRALHFAIATANLACQVAFLFPATHRRPSPMCIAPSSGALPLYSSVDSSTASGTAPPFRHSFFRKEMLPFLRAVRAMFAVTGFA